MSVSVLVIEDEPDIRKTIDYNLSKESYKVIQAASIAEGKKAIVENDLAKLSPEKVYIQIEKYLKLIN